MPYMCTHMYITYSCIHSYHIITYSCTSHRTYLRDLKQPQVLTCGQLVKCLIWTTHIYTHMYIHTYVYHARCIHTYHINTYLCTMYALHVGPMHETLNSFQLVINWSNALHTHTCIYVHIHVCISRKMYTYISHDHVFMYGCISRRTYARDLKHFPTCGQLVKYPIETHIHIHTYVYITQDGYIPIT